ncbi:MAG: hypothetical protein KatS3mg012_1387 [Gaiellaceae bacterium]|jgi:undecaprenyl-diphosphatase|nr:MAG: hypothetical protein KatS3mg012_1387 [Gaiellaceae bacterium]
MSRLLSVLLVAGLAAFVGLALAHEHPPVSTIDEETARWIARELPAPFAWVARPFSWIGGWIGLTALGLVAAVVLVRERAWLDLGFFLAAFVASQLAVAALKDVIDRPRPSAGSAVPLPDSYAFPSGHATAAAASFGALAVLACERLGSRRARTWVWSGVVVLGLGIGLSRIALNVHYVSDVVAGWSLGLSWLAACLLARDRLRRAG